MMSRKKKQRVEMQSEQNRAVFPKKVKVHRHREYCTVADKPACKDRQNALKLEKNEQKVCLKQT
jgi:hypothetical protein